jgi:2-oxo-4-hydroxy-4-carboxy-5-ureidoimidazoline decarboxylase
MKSRPWTLAGLNAMDRDEFARVVGPVFESTPWIAAEAWSHRPFADFDGLHRALCDAVWLADEARQVELIRAHPELAGRAASAGSLTPESQNEQASAGLGRLSADEAAKLQELNREYRQRFGFPFVICARLNKKDSILNSCATRLKNTRDAELKIALEEIAKIARLRLEDLVAG